MKDIVDFNNFWNKKIKLIDAVQSKYKLKKTSFSKFENIEFYDLTFTSYDNSVIYAKYIKNINYRKLYPQKNIPLLFYFHGYPASNRNWLEKSTFATLGYDVVAIDFRNQGGKSKDFGKSDPSVFGHLTVGLDGNIEDMIFYKNILDSLILAKIVSSFEDINEKELVSFGASQGGAFSIIFSALNKNVTKEEVNNLFKNNTNETINYTEDPIVSSDVIGMKYATLVDGLSTDILEVNGKQLLKIMTWYDNETSFTAQMLRTTKYLMK